MNNETLNKISYPYLWPVGAAGLVAPQRVVAVGDWRSAPIRRAARQAKIEGRLIDLTGGKACQWVIFLDNGQLALGSEPAPVAVVEDEQYDWDRDPRMEKGLMG